MERCKEKGGGMVKELERWRDKRVKDFILLTSWESLTVLAFTLSICPFNQLWENFFKLSGSKTLMSLKEVKGQWMNCPSRNYLIIIFLGCTHTERDSVK